MWSYSALVGMSRMHSKVSRIVALLQAIFILLCITGNPFAATDKPHWRAALRTSVDFRWGRVESRHCVVTLLSAVMGNGTVVKRLAIKVCLH